jgi:hypothetical protein
MPSNPQEDAERLARLEHLVEKLTGELDSLREEGRVISSAMAEDAKAKAARAKSAQRQSTAARERAGIRDERTRKRTRHKRR